jgi:hypothetical protein
LNLKIVKIKNMSDSRLSLIFLLNMINLKKFKSLKKRFLLLNFKFFKKFCFLLKQSFLKKLKLNFFEKKKLNKNYLPFFLFIKRNNLFSKNYINSVENNKLVYFWKNKFFKKTFFNNSKYYLLPHLDTLSGNILSISEFLPAPNIILYKGVDVNQQFCSDLFFNQIFLLNLLEFYKILILLHLCKYTNN